MELEGQDFHAKVADGYLRIAEEHPERVVVVDADRQPAEVFDEVRTALDKALGERGDEEGGIATSLTGSDAQEESVDRAATPFDPSGPDDRPTD
jgi:dTMP kinase